MLRGIAGLLILGIVGRLLMGVMMRAALDSVLAVGVLHQIFDASNNGGFVDSLLDGADAGDMTQFAAVILTVWSPGGCFGDGRAYSPSDRYRFSSQNHAETGSNTTSADLTRMLGGT